MFENIIIADLTLSMDNRTTPIWLLYFHLLQKLQHRPLRVSKYSLCSYRSRYSTETASAILGN